MPSLRSKKRKPTSPAEILREDIMPELKMSQRKLAAVLRISRYKISQLIKERSSIDADIAIRLAKFLGGIAASWLNMQQALDIWQLEQDNAQEY